MADKKISVNWENGKAVSFEVNGKIYSSLEEIKNQADRKKVKAILDASAAEEGSDKRKSFFSMERMVLTAFTIVAIVMLIITFISSSSAISTLMQEKSAAGVVMDNIVQREYENKQDRIYTDYYFPVVSFTANDGKRRQVQMSVGSDSLDYEKGDEVTVLYDPKHPLDARIKSFGGAALLWILPVITGILGVSFLTAVVVVKKVMLTETGQD
ncbi:MAG: DUF3592 domain-containing protein [Chloroflexota bacterium]